MLEVVAQDPAPGARVAHGTTVHATLGLRPHRVPAMIRVPDVVGLTLTDAERMLEAAGFTVRATFVRGGGRRGVTGQLPGVGTLHPRGGEVRLTVRR
jgi:beta-lactam-binding protein with PASTA domain